MGFYGNTLIIDESFFGDFIGDVEYFDMNKVDIKIKAAIYDIKDEDEKSAALRKILYSLITNVGNACRRQLTLKKLYESHYRYNHIIRVLCNKYISQINDSDKRKLRGAIDNQFTSGLNPAVLNPNDLKFPVKMSKEAKAKLSKEGISVTKKLINIPNPLSMGLDIASAGLKIVGKYIWRTIGEAMRFYKMTSQGSGFIGFIVSDNQKKMYKYFFEITAYVLEDIVKVYRMV